MNEKFEKKERKYLVIWERSWLVHKMQVFALTCQTKMRHYLMSLPICYMVFVLVDKVKSKIGVSLQFHHFQTEYSLSLLCLVFFS